MLIIILVQSVCTPEPEFKATECKLPSDVNELLHKLEIKCKKLSRLRGNRSLPSAGLTESTLPVLATYFVGASFFGKSGD
jgi:hypothetical protein